MDNLNFIAVEVVEQLTTEAGTKVLNLTAYSTDFNPIEMLWSVFKYLMLVGQTSISKNAGAFS